MVVHRARLRTLRAIDLRRTCIHEYGHFFVARHLGVLGSVSIWPNPRGGANTKYYRGHFQPYQTLGGATGRLIGLAGEVAVCYDSNPCMPPDGIKERLDAEIKYRSRSDARLLRGYTVRDIEQCLAIIEQRWTEIFAAAKNHIAVEALSAADGAKASPAPPPRDCAPNRRDRVAEGRYQMHADELRALRADRRALARQMRESGSAWSEIGAMLGITAGAARNLASRA